VGCLAPYLLESCLLLEVVDPVRLHLLLLLLLVLQKEGKEEREGVREKEKLRQEREEVIGKEKEEKEEREEVIGKEEREEVVLVPEVIVRNIMIVTIHVMRVEDVPVKEEMMNRVMEEKEEMEEMEVTEVTEATEATEEVVVVAAALVINVEQRVILHVIVRQLEQNYVIGVDRKVILLKTVPAAIYAKKRAIFLGSALKKEKEIIINIVETQVAIDLLIMEEVETGLLANQEKQEKEEGIEVKVLLDVNLVEIQAPPPIEVETALIEIETIIDLILLTVIKIETPINLQKIEEVTPFEQKF